MVPYEAFLSEKPVVTTTDWGGPLEVVADRRTGLVCEPQAAALPEACSWLRNHADDAKAWGQAGKEIARRASGDETIVGLVSGRAGCVLLPAVAGAPGHRGARCPS